MSVETMDPALKRLLDNLPAGDPDPSKDDRIEIRISQCEGVHVIPNGQPMKLRFGPWQGPPTLASDMKMTAQNLRTGNKVLVSDLRRSRDGKNILIKPNAYFSVEWLGQVI